MRLTLFLAVAALALASCMRVPDDDMIRKIVERAASLVESRDVNGFMDFVSDGFVDTKGNDRNAVKGIMFMHLTRQGTIKVFIRDMDVKVEGDRALVDARVVVVRGREVKSIKDVLPEEASAMRMSIVMKKEGWAWKAVSADWDSTGLAGLL